MLVGGLVVTPFVSLVLEYFFFLPGTVASQEAIWGRIRAAIFPWGLIVAGVILLVSVLARKESRDQLLRFLRRVKRLEFRWPFTTEKQRADELVARQKLDAEKFDVGYAKRHAEVAAEREAAERYPPSFSIVRRDDHHVGEFMLYNKGWMVGNVWLTAPEDEFNFDGDPPVWSGEFGDDSHGGSVGKYFYGLPTEKGLAHGVNFTVGWSWRNLDRDSKPLRVAADRLVPPSQ